VDGIVQIAPAPSVHTSVSPTTASAIGDSPAGRSSRAGGSGGGTGSTGGGSFWTTGGGAAERPPHATNTTMRSNRTKQL
jgi:hypothetical protein